MEDWQYRIEAKIDKMSDAIVSMARMEERMVTLFKRMDMYDERQNEVGRRFIPKLNRKANFCCHWVCGGWHRTNLYDRWGNCV